MRASLLLAAMLLTLAGAGPAQGAGGASAAAAPGARAHAAQVGGLPSLPVGPLPIPQTPLNGAPSFMGTPATPQGFYAPAPPRNPFMAANERSEIHDDAWQSDSYQISGPLGRSPQVLSTMLGADCASVAFDRLGRVLSVCVGLYSRTLYMFDPHTLATLASFPLPPRSIDSSSSNIFQSFGGGGYFYLDNNDRVVVPTTSRHVYVVAETGGAAAPGFSLARDYDLSAIVPAGDPITSVLPDWTGRMWAESFNGILVTIDPSSGALHSLALHEETENSFAVDETGGVFVVSTRALYRLDAAPSGAPAITWQAPYPNSQIHKPGQVDAGSGSTPTVQGPYVTITDNGNPMDVVVFKRARRIAGSREVCVQPVFGPGNSADENSLIGIGRVMIAENNYGYTGPQDTEGGRATAPGLERVDINDDGRGCHVVWETNAVSVPTTVSKLSLASGLEYTYTKGTQVSDPWYFTAVDLRTGRVVYQQLAGTGLGFNNNYAPVTIGPDGSAYVGVLGGLVEVRDATPPDVALPAPPPSGAGGACAGPAARLRLPLPAATVRARIYLDDRALLDRRGRDLRSVTVLLGARDRGTHRLRIDSYRRGGGVSSARRTLRNCRLVRPHSRRTSQRSPRLTG
jgi:hypothetical protein